MPQRLRHPHEPGRLGRAWLPVTPNAVPFCFRGPVGPGLQRHAWNWTADIECRWPGLGQQIATSIGLGLSGVPYTGSDIGGFSGIPTPELYLRWLELSVLMPFCRTHCVLGSPSREPWRFPEPYRGAIDRLIRFRYRLLPYLYTLAYEASEHGAPLVRPLAWPEEVGEGSSADPDLWQVNDAFAWATRLWSSRWPRREPLSARWCCPPAAGTAGGRRQLWRQRTLTTLTT